LFGAPFKTPVSMINLFNSMFW